MATPTPTVSPAPTPAPTIALWIQRELEGWTPVCDDVPSLDCHGVAALFVNNLARSWQWVQDQSGGLVTITPRLDCPALPDYFDGTICWQARAPIDAGDVCMVVARQLPEIAWKFGFGQVGGDDMTGRAIQLEPEDFPPCV